MTDMQLTCFRLLERPSFIPFLTPFLESELTHHTHKRLDTLAHRKLKEEQEEKASACKATSSGPSKVVTSQDNTVHLFMAPPTTGDTTAETLKTRADTRQRKPQLIDSRALRTSHSHKSRDCRSSPLANPTKITLG